MVELVQRIGLLSLTCSAVLLPLLLLSGRIRSRYRAKSCYLLWLLLSLRLLLPLEPQAPRPAVTIRLPEAAYTARQSVPEGRGNAEVPSSQPPAGTEDRPTPSVPDKPQTAPSLMEGIALVWHGGMLLFLTWTVAGYLLARRRLLAGAEERAEDGALSAELGKELGLPRPVPVLRTREAGSPLTLGLFRPLVLLPEACEDLTLVLRHELIHVKRGDLWYKALLIAVNGVHWFNPLVWLMCGEAGRNLEYCCDDAVVAGRDDDFRRRYGALLLRHAAAGGGAWRLVIQFGGSKERMKGRLMNLFEQKKPGAAMVCLVLCCALAAGLLVSCEPAAGEGPPEPRNAADGLEENIQNIRVTEDGALEYMSSALEGEPLFLPAVLNDSGRMLTRMPSLAYGSDVPRIDFMREEILVFHDYWGLVIYDREHRRVSRVLDTPALGMDLMRGDRVTEVRVAEDLSQLLLYNTPQDGDDTCYLYWPEDDLSLETRMSAVTDGFVTPDNLGLEAERAARRLGCGGLTSNFALLEDGTLCYLTFREGSNYTMADLELVEVDGTGGRRSYPICPAPDAGDGWHWPLPGHDRITNLFGARIHPITGQTIDHTGVDIAAPEDTPVEAARAGVVLKAEFDATYGNYVQLQHDGGTTTLYGQMKSLAVKPGDSVEQGQMVGRVGSTGAATGNHLHLEFQVNGTHADPMGYYPGLEPQVQHE